MTSDPSHPAREWPASPEPLDALPSTASGFAAADDRWHADQQRWDSDTGQQGWDAGTQWSRQAGPDRSSAAPNLAPPAASQDPDEERLAMLSYLGVPFLGPLVPLVTYLVKRHTSGFVRYHAVRALNLSISALLYTFCVLILGAMLALDSLVFALVISVPLTAALWLAVLGYVIRAASSANRGDSYQIPAWICATIVR